MTQKLSKKEAGRLGGKANKRGPRGINVTIRMSPDTVAALDRRAELESTDRTSLVREAVGKLLACGEKPTDRDILPGGPATLKAQWTGKATDYHINDSVAGILSTGDGANWKHPDGTMVDGPNWANTTVKFVGGPLNGKKLT